MRAASLSLLLALVACDNAPSAPPPTSAKSEACVHEPVTVRIENNEIFWNGMAVDESELARRAASHWCGERPYAIMMDSALPPPDDLSGTKLAMRVSRLVNTRPAALAETLRKLDEGTY